jgi:hypothetical protein
LQAGDNAMKKTLLILAVAMLLPIAAFAGKKKDSPPPDTTDWLNAPTPDGSPTLRATSDWLAQTLQAYGGGEHNFEITSYHDVHIANDCTLNYTYETIRQKATISGPKPTGKPVFITVSIPLGAVTDVSRDSDSSEVYRRIHALLIKTGNVAAVRIGTQYQSDDDMELMHQPPVTPGAELPQDSRDMVPRVISALQHAASLCRSVYKPPTQEKQPF